MPLETLADLVAAGAHRTIEQIYDRPGFDIAMAADYLTRRYGNQLQPQPGVLAALIERVGYGLYGAGEIELGDVPDVELIPVLPGSPRGITYTVIGEVSDPLAKEGQGRNVSFPMTFNSETILNKEQLQKLADELVTNAIAAGQTRFGGALHGQVTLPGAAAEVVRETTGDVALPKITVLSVYKGE
jgi:hypothetical protein